MRTLVKGFIVGGVGACAAVFGFVFLKESVAEYKRQELSDPL